MKALRILIVEDDDVFALEIERLLSSLGHDLIWRTDNAPDAIRMMKTIKPDLLLVDVHLIGEKTGIDIADQVQDQEVHIIFCTSDYTRSTYQSAQKSTPTAYLIKPFGMITLRKAINLALAGTRRRDEDAE